MSESLTDRTEPQIRRGAGEARFGAKSLMRDKASCLSKWLCDPKRAYAAIGYGRINVFGHSLFISPRFSIERICVILKKRKQDFITHTSEQTKPEHKKKAPTAQRAAGAYDFH